MWPLEACSTAGSRTPPASGRVPRNPHPEGQPHQGVTGRLHRNRSTSCRAHSLHLRLSSPWSLARSLLPPNLLSSSPSLPPALTPPLHPLRHKHARARHCQSTPFLVGSLFKHHCLHSLRSCTTRPPISPSTSFHSTHVARNHHHFGKGGFVGGLRSHHAELS